MPLHDYADWNDLSEDLEDLPLSSNQAAVQLRRKTQNKKATTAKKAVVAPAQLTNEEDSFRFTYQASRHEAQWLNSSLAEFFDQMWFADVLRMVKGGKEASVYQCLGNETTGQPFIAAKVYRPRRFRNLKNDHMYREGRDDLDANGHIITDDGSLHAMRKKTAFGMELLHTSWIEHEVKTMQLLKDAGADVPTLFASGNNALLMSYIGDEDASAPALSEIELETSEARPLLERVLWNIELMLSKHRIHGDLSAFNILYHDGEITLIDFPQAIDPRRNVNAFRVFERDVVRVCEYFAQCGVRKDGRKIAASLWKAYHYSQAPELDPRFLDAEDQADRKAWSKQAGR